MTSATMQQINSKPLHEIIPYVQAMTQLWIRGDDVAIPYLVGVPGIAKTALLLEMCKVNDWNLLHLHFIRPIEEISGMPDFRDIEVVSGPDGETKKFEGTFWRLPDVMTELIEIAANGKPTIWFFDDYHLASPAHLHLSYEMFSQDRKLRGYKIPDNVGFVLAGNDSSKAGARTQFSAVTNRCAKFYVHLDFDYWKNNYAYARQVNSKVISFLSHANYSRWFCGEEKADKPWSSPRSWTRFARMLTILEHNRTPTQDDVLYLGTAHVGEEASSDFSGYYTIYSKINIGDVFDGKLLIQIPPEMVNRYVFMIAATMEMTDRIMKSSSKSVINSTLMTYCQILGQMAVVSSEIAVSGMKEVALIEASLKISKLFQTMMEVLRSKCPPAIVEKLMTDVRLL